MAIVWSIATAFTGFAGGLGFAMLLFARALVGVGEAGYSSGGTANPLFTATDALGTALPPMGAVSGRVMGSYAHVIDIA